MTDLQNDLPCKLALDDKRKSFTCKKAIIEVLRGKMKIANVNEIMSRPSFKEPDRVFVTHPLHYDLLGELYRSIRFQIRGTGNY